MTDDPQLDGDVRLVESIIRDNERWNSKGTTQEDIFTVFAGSDRLGWDWGDESKRRFRRALDAATGIILVEGRYFPSGSPNLVRHRRKLGAGRVCEGPRCVVDISHLNGHATYCSDRCRMAAARKREAVTENGSRSTRSEALKREQKSLPGTWLPPESEALQTRRSEEVA